MKGMPFGLCERKKAHQLKTPTQQSNNKSEHQEHPLTFGANDILNIQERLDKLLVMFILTSS